MIAFSAANAASVAEDHHQKQEEEQEAVTVFITKAIAVAEQHNKQQEEEEQIAAIILATKTEHARDPPYRSFLRFIVLICDRCRPMSAQWPSWAFGIVLV